MGVHQKIDRVARKHIADLLPEHVTFPTAKAILHFEGKNGPDGIKRKSPAVDEPWHFVDPAQVEGSELLRAVDEHRHNLAQALRDKNIERAAFEASWMAHAVADGLTPAHHYPLEEKLRELRQGEGNETRTSVLKKGLMKGDTRVEALKNNWRFWGAKGTMTTHIAFEMGVASVVAYKRFLDGKPGAEEILRVQREGFEAYLTECIREVAGLQMYENFSAAGWTTMLAKQTNAKLMPLIIRAVVLGWLSAAWLAEEGEH